MRALPATTAPPVTITCLLVILVLEMYCAVSEGSIIHYHKGRNAGLVSIWSLILICILWKVTLTVVETGICESKADIMFSRFCTWQQLMH